MQSYLQWRASGFDGITADSVAQEAATGKAKLLAQRDLVRMRGGRTARVLGTDTPWPVACGTSWAALSSW